jgi:hypothetical protein
MAIFGPNRWWLWGKDAFVSRPPHKKDEEFFLRFVIKG